MNVCKRCHREFDEAEDVTDASERLGWFFITCMSHDGIVKKN